MHPNPHREAARAASHDRPAFSARPASPGRLPLHGWPVRGAAVLLALLLWEGVALLLGQSLLLPSPVAVVGRLFTLCREPGFLSALWQSFSRIVGGFLWGFAVGIVLGALAGHLPVAEILLRPYVITVKSVPVASFVVLALVWLTSAKLSTFISFLMVLPVIYNGVLGGLGDRDPAMDEMAAVFRLSPMRRVVFVEIPRVKPHLFSATALALGLAWKSGIAAELIGIPSGSVGEALYRAKVGLETTDLFAWTVVIVLCSVGFEKLWLLGMRCVFRLSERVAGGGV